MLYFLRPTHGTTRGAGSALLEGLAGPGAFCRSVPGGWCSATVSPHLSVVTGIPDGGPTVSAGLGDARHLGGPQHTWARPRQRGWGPGGCAASPSSRAHKVGRDLTEAPSPVPSSVPGAELSPPGSAGPRCRTLAGAARGGPGPAGHSPHGHGAACAIFIAPAATRLRPLPAFPARVTPAGCKPCRRAANGTFSGGARAVAPGCGTAPEGWGTRSLAWEGREGRRGSAPAGAGLAPKHGAGGRGTGRGRGASGSLVLPTGRAVGCALPWLQGEEGPVLG